MQLLLLDTQNENNLINLINLIAKRYIYTCRVNSTKPSVTIFIQKLKQYRTIEETIALRNNRIDIFLEEKWRDFTL